MTIYTAAPLINFEGIAGLIDSVLGAAPEQLATLLEVLRSSHARLEARVVLEIVLRCRDPLAPLGTLCRDALKTASELDVLLRTLDRDARAIQPSVRANALRNLCNAALREPNPHTVRRRRRIRIILPAVKVAAVTELNERRDEIERLSVLREAACPGLRKLLENYLSSARNRRTQSQATETAAPQSTAGTSNAASLPTDSGSRS